MTDKEGTDGASQADGNAPTHHEVLAASEAAWNVWRNSGRAPRFMEETSWGELLELADRAEPWRAYRELVFAEMRAALVAANAVRVAQRAASAASVASNPIPISIKSGG